MQDRLSHVRAFINCHIDLLQDPSPLAPLTVTDVVEQLALQESDSVFDSDAAPQWNASMSRLARAEGNDVVVCNANTTRTTSKASKVSTWSD